MGDDKRDKLKEPVPIGRILSQILQTGRRAEDSATARVWNLWDEAVGGFIAENARPAAIKGNILLVYVNSSPWLHQLHFLKPEIIEKLNHALGENLVADIKFKIGPVE